MHRLPCARESLPGRARRGVIPRESAQGSRSQGESAQGSRSQGESAQGSPSQGERVASRYAGDRASQLQLSVRGSGGIEQTLLRNNSYKLVCGMTEIDQEMVHRSYENGKQKCS